MAGEEEPAGGRRERKPAADAPAFTAGLGQTRAVPEVSGASGCLGASAGRSRPPSDSGGHRASIGDLDVDLERRRCRAAIHRNLELVLIDFDVFGDHGHDFLPQKGDEVRLVPVLALIRQQKLQAFPGDRRAAAALEEIYDKAAR